MKVSEARKLIGKPIKYRPVARDYVYPWTNAVILELSGRNVLVDRQGMTDWLWLPDVQIVPIKEESQNDESNQEP